MINIMEFIRGIYYHIWRFFHLEYCLYPEHFIPENTIYCYKILKIEMPNIKIKPCIFHKKLWYDLCMYNGSDCLMDSCKTCGINEDIDD